MRAATTVCGRQLGRCWRQRPFPTPTRWESKVAVRCTSGVSAGRFFSVNLFSFKLLMRNTAIFLLCSAVHMRNPGIFMRVVMLVTVFPLVRFCRKTEFSPSIHLFFVLVTRYWLWQACAAFKAHVARNVSVTNTTQN